VPAALVVLAMFAGGCSSGSQGPGPDPGRGSARWIRIVATLPDRLDSRSSTACGSGSRACLDAVVDEMRRRFEILARACDHKAPFALMYLRVTEGVGNTGAGRFRDPDYLNHLDAIFATLYFDAFDAWIAGRDVPEAWAVAFASADARRTSTLGDLLLGMNAHISRDLPFALERAGLTTPSGRSARSDFDRVNALLGDVSAPMLREQSERFDPGVERATLPVLDLDADGLALLLARWRTEAWGNARRLVAARGAEHSRIAAAIEQAAAGRARLIEALMSNLVLGPSTEERDRYCERRAR
jgi:hypothetical protein